MRHASSGRESNVTCSRCGPRLTGGAAVDDTLVPPMDEKNCAALLSVLQRPSSAAERQAAFAPLAGDLRRIAIAVAHGRGAQLATARLEAEDVAQIALEKLLVSPPSAVPVSARALITAWVKTVTIRVIADSARKHCRLRSDTAAGDDGDGATLSERRPALEDHGRDAEMREALGALRTCGEELPAAYRRVFEVFAREGSLASLEVAVRVGEIDEPMAAALRATRRERGSKRDLLENRVEARVSRMRRALAECMGRLLGEDGLRAFGLERAGSRSQTRGEST